MSTVRGRLALIVGHEKKRPGAWGVAPISTSEYEFNGALAGKAQTIGQSRGHEVEVFRRDEIGIEGAYRRAASIEPDAIIELHFNAFNGAVRGTETLYADESDEKGVMELEFAESIQAAMCSALSRVGKEDRGVKSRPWRGGERGAKSLGQLFNIPCILVEPFFGDNKKDAQLAVNQRELLAASWIEGFERWLVSVAIARGYVESENEVAKPISVARPKLFDSTQRSKGRNAAPAATRSKATGRRARK